MVLTVQQLYDLAYQEGYENQPISLYITNPETNICTAEPDICDDDISFEKGYVFINLDEEELYTRG